MNRNEIIHTDFFNNVKVIAEVGVLRGTYAGALNRMKDLNEFHLIDPWRIFPKEEFNDYPKKTQQDWDKTYEFVENKFRGVDYVTIHRGTSLEVAPKFSPNYFDMVYIDANHKYKYVFEDISTWLPKVKKGGILGGHDFDTKSVREAVLEYFDEKDLLITSEQKRATSWFVKI